MSDVQNFNQIADIEGKEELIEAPALDDSAAYGGYLVNSVLACGACHTLALENGSPDAALALAGGSAFSGEWGTVYASNITPDQTTGIGSYHNDRILLAMISGRALSENRPLYMMPQSYNQLEGADAQAVLDYLQSIDPIEHEVPPADLRPGYEQYPTGSKHEASWVSIAVTILVLLMLGVASVYLIIRQYRQNQRLRTIDWEEHFQSVIAKARNEDKESTSSKDETNHPLS